VVLAFDIGGGVLPDFANKSCLSCHIFLCDAFEFGIWHLLVCVFVVWPSRVQTNMRFVLLS